MNYAIITNNVVENVILASPAFAAQIGAIECPDTVSIGWGYDGTFTAPVPVVVVPKSVTMRQARLAMLNAGLLEIVNEAIVTAGSAALIEWEYAKEVERSSGLVPQMATALGLTESQIDALFIQAATL